MMNIENENPPMTRESKINLILYPLPAHIVYGLVAGYIGVYQHEHFYLLMTCAWLIYFDTLVIIVRKVVKENKKSFLTKP